MNLARVRLRNFRCYKDELTVDFDRITAFVGRNDIGKSAIMDALNIFLNDELPDKHDATKDGDGKDLTIICEFDDLPAEIIIDDANPTRLADEFLLNADGRLEIHKTFSGHTASPKLTAVSVYAVHPTADGAKDLLKLKNADLKARAKQRGVDISGIDPKLNAPIRKSLRDSIPDLKLAAHPIPLAEDNAKNVWDGLRAQLPTFALFKADRESTDQDPEAQDPLKAAVKEAIKAQEAELVKIASFIEQEVKKVAQKTVEKTREMDPSLATTLNPQFTPPKWDTLFKATITGDGDIPLNKRGSGVRRLLLLNFFRAKAELEAKERNKGSIIYGIEEPEASQHPHNQRLLVRSLIELSTDSQIILTTHTPMLARTLPDHSLRYIRMNHDETRREILIGGDDTNQLFARSLGVLPDHSVRLFIGVEGPHDITFLRNVSKLLRASDTNVLDLGQMELDGEVIFVPLGGSSLILWTSRLKDLKRPEFYLYDRDNPPPASAKYQKQADSINARPNCKALITTKKEIENYIHYAAINQTYADPGIGINLNLQTAFGDFDDVPLLIAEMVHNLSGSPTPWSGLSVDPKRSKVSHAKTNLGRASARMTKAQLDAVDPSDEVLGWLTSMKTLMEQAGT